MAAAQGQETTIVQDPLPEIAIAIMALLLRMAPLVAPRRITIVHLVVDSTSDMMLRHQSLRARQILGDLHPHRVIGAMDQRMGMAPDSMAVADAHPTSVLGLIAVDLVTVEGAVPGWPQTVPF